MTFAVVLREPEVPNEHMGALADALAKVTGMARIDALQSVKRVEGIVLDGVAADVAKPLAESVRRLGLDAGVAPLEAVTRYRRRLLLQGAECLKAGFRLKTGPDRWQVARWGSIRAGSLTLYQQPKEVRRPEGRRPRLMAKLAVGLASFGVLSLTGAARLNRMISARGTTRRLAGEETYILDLFVEPGVTLRLNARDLRYSYLGERMADRWEKNFHTFVADVADGATEAALAPAVDRFLKGESIDDTTLTDLHDFDLFNRWFLLAVAAFPPPDRPDPSAPAGEA